MSVQGPAPLSEGTELLGYRLLARIAGDVWRAENTRSQKQVAIKILTRVLPADKGRRDALLAQVRQSTASLRHPALVSVEEVGIANDALFLAMELVEGGTLGARLRRDEIKADEYFRLAFQLASALDQAHAHDVYHGGLTVDDILLDRNGNVRLGGFTFAALTGRRERGDAAMLEQAKDVKALAYLSPEQLAGNPVDRMTDVYSFGVILYAMATRRLPFEAANAAEMIQKVGTTNPRNPQELNTAVTRPMLQLIGKAVFKNRSARYGSMKEIIEDIRKAVPDIEKSAAYPLPPRSTPSMEASMPKGPAAQKKLATFVIAELPYHDVLLKDDPEQAAQLSARMQQIVGEAVYLFDGEILDSTGPRLVSLIPSSKDAIDAIRKAQADLLEFNASQLDSSKVVEPRIVVHRGEVSPVEANLVGPAADLALQLMDSMQPMQLLVSSAVLRDAAVSPGAALGQFGGVSFYGLPEPPAAAPAPATEGIHPVAAEDLVPVAASEKMGKAKRKLPLVPIVAAALVIVFLAGSAVVFMRQRNAAAEAAAAAAAASAKKPVAAPVQVAPSKVFIAAFDITTTDPATAERAKKIAQGVTALLRASGTPLSDAPSADALQLTVRASSPDPITQVVPQLSGKPEGPAVNVGETGVAISEIARWVGRSINAPVDRFLSANPVANEKFAEALSVQQSDPAAALAAINAAVAADADFLAAQRLAVKLNDAAGQRQPATTAAMRVADLDNADIDIRKLLARWSAEAADPVRAVHYFAETLSRKPDDVAALEGLARYALAAGDEQAFNKLVARIESAAGPNARIHRPDTLTLAGSFDRAAPRYYDIEANQQNNPALALKIGRIAALRDSFEIASIELVKLRKLDPDYGAPLLEAYIAAKKELIPEMEAALQRAQAGAAWDEDVYAYAAELYAMFEQRKNVITALEKAQQRGEAHATFVLLRPPYFYLGYDQQSVAIKANLEAQKFALRGAFAKLPL